MHCKCTDIINWQFYNSYKCLTEKRKWCRNFTQNFTQKLRNHKKNIES